MAQKIADSSKVKLTSVAVDAGFEQYLERGVGSTSIVVLINTKDEMDSMFHPDSTSVTSPEPCNVDGRAYQQLKS